MKAPGLGMTGENSPMNAFNGIADAQVDGSVAHCRIGAHAAGAQLRRE
jgi:hypothetical protein